MNPNRPTGTYIQNVFERIQNTCDRIANRAPVTKGRVIPEAENLAINDGRNLSATVLFLDICKFSSRPSDNQQQQENVLRTLNLFFSEMFRIIGDYEGTVEKNTGDGLMAYFVPDPNQGTTAQHKAVSAALTIFHVMQHFINPIIRNSGLPEIDFRITMDHGSITVARIGAARRFSGIVAVGTTANIASKMLGFAKPNTILLGENVLPGLPDSWRQFVNIETRDTGWAYGTGDPYSFYRYEGRWSY